MSPGTFGTVQQTYVVQVLLGSPPVIWSRHLSSDVTHFRRHVPLFQKPRKAVSTKLNGNVLNVVAFNAEIYDIERSFPIKKWQCTIRKYTPEDSLYVCTYFSGWKMR